VLRGYQKLRDEGLVELRRGRGALISDGADPGRGRLVQHIHELAAEARAVGLTDDELLTLISRTLNPGTI
ncbi:GntR family transcriptional regulator, partial [Streptomyces sp. NPDC058953]